MTLENDGDLLMDGGGDITTTGDISGTNLFGDISNTTGAPNSTNGMPAGGTVGQIIEKKSSTNYDADWVDKSSFTGWIVGEIKGFKGTIGSIPTGWHLCDGTNGTPDMRGRSMVAAGTGYTDGTSGGALPSTGTANSAGAHTHTGSAASNGNHSHTITVNNGGSHSHGASSGAGSLHGHSMGQNLQGFGALSGGEILFFAYTIDPPETSLEGSHTHGVTVSAGGTHSHTASSNSTGAHTHTITANSNGAHTHTTTAPDLPPYYVVTGFIMYTGVA